jgi:hypothetical protein
MCVRKIHSYSREINRPPCACVQNPFLYTILLFSKLSVPLYSLIYYIIFLRLDICVSILDLVITKCITKHSNIFHKIMLLLD